VSEYDNELRGVLFKNKQKRPDKKDADYRGNATINGVEYWLDSWVNESKGGVKYMSVNFMPKNDQPAAAKATPAAAALTDADVTDTDIPF